MSDKANMRVELNPGRQLFPERGGPTGESPVSTDGYSSGSCVDECQGQLAADYVQIRALAAQAARLPEVGQEKVSALRQTVSGTGYRPSSEQVAEALFAHMLVKSVV
jgi:hypothetical protein